MISEFVQFADERENMLLHVLRLEAKDIIGGPREDRGQGRMPVMPQTLLLRPDLSPAVGSKSASAGKLEECF